MHWPKYVHEHVWATLIRLQAHRNSKCRSYCNTPLTTSCVLWSILNAGTKQRYVPPSESWRLLSLRKTWPLSSSRKTSALSLYAGSCSFVEAFPRIISNTFLVLLCLQWTVCCFSSSTIRLWLHFKRTELPSVLSTTWWREARKHDFS